MAKRTAQNILVERLSSGRKRWSVRRANNVAPTKRFSTQKEAIRFGSVLAKRDGTELKIYSVSGSLRRVYFSKNPILKLMFGSR